MIFKTFRRIRVLALSLAAVTATTTLFAIAGAAGPAAAAASSGCPASKTGLPVAPNVAAGFTNAGTTSTYTFVSLTNETPSAGVPGLIKYCVYPTPTAQPKTVAAQAMGDNGARWIVGTGSNNFAFVRPSGNPSNIGLDGKSHTMGTATWNTLPTSQSIVLHINDPTTCASLYGAGTSATCFVTPSPLPPSGPVCNAGDTTVAYNALPTDVVNCLNPAIGFEAQSASEFGNGVQLAGPTGDRHVTLKVDFQSFACQSGQWNAAVSPCSMPNPSNPNFSWPITANIYAVGTGGVPGALLGTVTTPQVIPYRPAATPSCPANGGPAPIGAAWFNPAAVGGGACQNSIGKVLEFDFPNTVTIPANGQVIWTVAFDTSDFGAQPRRPQACNTGPDAQFPGLADGGCPYDSLNVGDNGNTGGADNPGSHISGAPYAGSDITTGVAYLNQGSGLQSQTGWDGLRPLGEIITTP
jgi:hypothetical protein